MQKVILLLGVLGAGLLAGIAYWAVGSRTPPPLAAVAEPAPPPPPTVTPPPKVDEAANQKVPRPTILTRKQWNARDPRGPGKQHTIDRITIHHTAVAQKAETPIEKKLQNLQSFSQSESKLASGKLKPAWIDVPYHFYIAVDGKIAEGRMIQFASDTNTEYDPTGHATMVVEGNFETEQPTAEQQAALQALTAWLAAQYQVPASRIKAHNDYAKTACPGVNLKKSLPALVEKVAELAGVPEKR